MFPFFFIHFHRIFVETFTTNLPAFEVLCTQEIIIVIGRCRGVCERKEKMIAKVSNNFKYQFLITGNELWMLELSSGLCIDDGFKPLICICKSCHYQSTEAFQYRLIHSINSINPLRNFNFNSAVRST